MSVSVSLVRVGLHSRNVCEVMHIQQALRVQRLIMRSTPPFGTCWSTLNSRDRGWARRWWSTLYAVCCGVISPTSHCLRTTRLSHFTVPLVLKLILRASRVCFSCPNTDFVIANVCRIIMMLCAPSHSLCVCVAALEKTSAKTSIPLNHSLWTEHHVPAQQGRDWQAGHHCCTQQAPRRDPPRCLCAVHGVRAARHITNSCCSHQVPV